MASGGLVSVTPTVVEFKDVKKGRIYTTNVTVKVFHRPPAQLKPTGTRRRDLPMLTIYVFS
jgi:hypothetical protein